MRFTSRTRRHSSSLTSRNGWRGQIPAAFQEELLARTQELVNAVNCPPPVVQPQEQADADEDDGPGRGKKKGHEKKKKKKGRG